MDQPAVYGNVSLASDGRRVAVNKTDNSSLNTDIWTYDLLAGNVFQPLRRFLCYSYL